MTHSGGKPHQTSPDGAGKRFEVRAEGWPKNHMSTVGWCDTRAAAERWARGVLKAPGCKRAEFEDRQEKTVTAVE